MRSVLTYSALNCYRNCPRRYKLRYIDLLRRPEQPESLAFGTVIHEALQRWYTLPADNRRLLAVLDFIDSQYPNRGADAKEKANWHLARVLLMGYAERYAQEEFEVLHVEKEFEAEIRNPETGRPSQTFSMAGKAD
ncbi:MAG: PD-(D/E)XK nuclease family protein, partial [Planctomycetota bacterium]|nr:PD-(D/E)XK nuclease family protein [Planctomycetota bacterium]